MCVGAIEHGVAAELACKPEDIFGGRDEPVCVGCGRVACFTSSGMVAVSSPSILVRFSFDSDSSAAAPFCEEGWARERGAGVGERSR